MKPQPRYHRGERIANRYLVHQALLGGMGEVYLCLDLEENYPYALKTFQQRYLTDPHRLRQAFEQEVATWVALEKHPNIVCCFWMQPLDNQPFMCLEWIAGEEGRGADLRSWLRRGTLDLKLALQIAIDICHGLLHAQTKQPGLVHCDLKPENILIAQGGLAKITDFGLAQIVQAAGLEIDQASAADSRHSLVGKGGVAGTPAYMAPEQWRGEPLDECTDIYALGCILHEMLTGQQPFVVDFRPTTSQQWQHWLQAMQEAHEHTPYPRLPGSFATPLQELLAACLTKAPEDRPSGLTDLLACLITLYQTYFTHPPSGRPAPGKFTESDYNNRGATYHELGRYDRALADFNRAFQDNPNFTLAYINRGATYATLKDYQAALADFNRALELDPSFGIAFANRGLIHHSLQEYSAALADFNRALALDPQDAEVYVNRGLTYRTLEKYDLAIADYSRAINLNPNNAQAYYNRGLVHASTSEYEAALADFSRCLKLDITYAQAYYNRGLTYANVGEHQAALVDYSRAIDLGLTDAQTYHHRGVFYAALGQREAAVADYTHALTLDPNYTLVYYNRGVSYVELGEIEAALADFIQTLTLDSKDARAHFNAGVLLENQGQLGEALSYFEEATRLGELAGTQHVNRVRQRLNAEAGSQTEPIYQALAAFEKIESLSAMQQVVAQFPVLGQAEFIMLIEQAITKPELSDQRPALQERLIWLGQIVE